MVWLGTLVLIAGAILIFTVDPLVVGAGTMALGAALLITGILRLNRARRSRSRARLPVRDYRTGSGKIAAMVFTVLYIVSPIDLIPDVLLPIGIVDDATAFTWLLFALGQEYSRHSRKQRA